MYNLKISSLLLVGTPEEKRHFEIYFKEVKLLADNNEVLKYYKNSIFSVIFLSCDSQKGNVFDICKKIRISKKSVVMALLSSYVDNDRLKKALPLHLSGCIERPFEMDKVEEVLVNIDNELEFLNRDIVRLRDGYHFYTNQKVLHNDVHDEVKLTKNELKLLMILIKSKDKFIAGEQIEHELWSEDSWEIDCTNRLKNLLYHLRKKLPKNSIVNNYRLGYKLS